MRLCFFFPWHSYLCFFCFQNLFNILLAKSKSCAILTPTNISHFCKLKSCREGLKVLKELSSHSFLTCWAGTKENKPTTQKTFSMREGAVPIKLQCNKHSSASTYCKPGNNHISTMIAAYFSSKTILADLIHIT